MERRRQCVLDGLLYHALSLMPREHYTDSHGYTDIVFALTYLLGFRLAPRMAKLPDLTLWYGKGYDVENQELFDGRITEESIASQWDAVQRISATIKDGRTRASQIIRKVSAFNCYRIEQILCQKAPTARLFSNLRGYPINTA